MSDKKDAEMLAPGSPSRQRLKTEQIIEEAKKKKEVYTILEDDDEFEEFEDYDNYNAGDADMKDQGDEDKLWQETWDDDELDDNFIDKLRNELKAHS
mmetsp:Transcript_19587/g.21892  ORF Transcript_19587/g.21892 Transcript_19587/m.21892 type:complete len:97 (+) Transcript_19587:40-330(+)|eukprot:CAMPEP_0205806806 /NCGR_PEP_ID=MMETSP0205-20121125/10435_1 /ASSEMBLY_ACC=CAM_ASM_000278 /TAXON_ID=36767 /ORGANISM="Euplotes focardii, Strain TN1" /LENGTH=96 /DNA_ID=CAMNT_0053080203 /DNA_START=103 /DNA_END=393 /DNA_ORIENTATION=-